MYTKAFSNADLIGASKEKKTVHYKDNKKDSIDEK
jgi:hypothetical protein